MLSSLAWQRIPFLMPLEVCNIDENERFGVLAGVCLEPGLDPHPILSACSALLPADPHAVSIRAKHRLKTWYKGKRTPFWVTFN